MTLLARYIRMQFDAMLSDGMNHDNKTENGAICYLSKEDYGLMDINNNDLITDRIYE